jgi:hypothetical protein
MPDDVVNCGRCAHLWCRKRGRPGHGVCACAARRTVTGEIYPTVHLDSTCAHAQLSAKFDPDFMPRVWAARRGGIPRPSLLAPVSPPPAPTPKPETREIYQDSLF